MRAGRQAREAWAVAVAEVPGQRDGEVHAQLCGDADGVDLQLGVVQTALEEGGVEGEGGDGAGAEAKRRSVRRMKKRAREGSLPFQESPDEAAVPHHFAGLALAVHVLDALGHGVEEGGAGGGGRGLRVGAEQRAGGAVVVESVYLVGFWSHCGGIEKEIRSLDVVAVGGPILHQPAGS